MAPMIAYTLPAMQLVCNLVVPQAPGLTSNNFDSKNQNVSIVNGSLGLEHDAGTTSNPPVTVSLPKIEVKTLPDGYERPPELGAAFKVHNDTATHPVADKRCVAEGGNLAVIDSWRKFDVVQALLPTGDEYYFVGIIRMYETKNWVDIRTGSPLFGLPWDTNEPEGDFYCAEISRKRRGLWIYKCLDENRFVCEIQVPQSLN